MTISVAFQNTAFSPQSSDTSATPCAAMYSLNSRCSAPDAITSAPHSGRVTIFLTATGLPRGLATPLSSYSSGGSSLTSVSTSIGA